MDNLQDKFSFFLPMDLAKSEVTNSEDEEEMYICGYASTGDTDRQGENVLQKGLDISEFVNHGWYNFDHDNSKILGYPDKERTKIDAHGLYVAGKLLKSVPLAREIYNISKELIKSNAPRRYGFSIEGKTLARDPYGKIIKAKVYNVAITPNPVNCNTSLELLVKSFSTEIGFDTQPEVTKGMEVGYSTNIGDTNSGSVLKRESLDSAFKILAKAGLGDEESCKFLRDAIVSPMSTDEAILYFQISRGLSRSEAAKLVESLNINKEE